jgi:hypothetical protein
MAGQAIALAAVEGQFLTLGNGRLRLNRACESGADQQRQDEGWLCGASGDQVRFPDVLSVIPAEYRGSKAQRPLAGNAEKQAWANRG